MFTRSTTPKSISQIIAPPPFIHTMIGIDCVCALNRRESSSGRGGEVAVRVRPLIQREIKAISSHVSLYSLICSLPVLYCKIGQLYGS